MFTIAAGRALAIMAALSLPALTSANVIEGTPKVIDGDSFRVAGTEVRLFGVDAPEYTQTCFDNGQAVPCGVMAKEALKGLIGDGVLACVPQETDAYGRIVARCGTSGVDVGDALVAAGWATAFRRYSDEYAAAEHAPEPRGQESGNGISRCRRTSEQASRHRSNSRAAAGQQPRPEQHRAGSSGTVCV